MIKSLHEMRLTLLNVNKVSLDARWNFENVISPFARIYLIKSGRGIVYHHNKKFILKRGYLYIIPPFTFGRYVCNNRMVQYFSHFFEETGKGLSVFTMKEILYEVKAIPEDEILFRRLIKINPDRGLLKHNPKLYENRSTLLQFAERNNSMNAADFIETHGILQILLSRFVKNEPAKADKNSYSNKINNILNYIHEHLADPLSVAQLAAQCHLDADYFSRIFKNQTGLRPIPYINNKRIERAQLLLSTTKHSIQEIADMTGLPNISYFNRVFSLLTKKTPTAYRKEHWNT
jgi:YesN/AraC family two-component response regulator